MVDRIYHLDRGYDRMEAKLRRRDGRRRPRARHEFDAANVVRRRPVTVTLALSKGPHLRRDAAAARRGRHRRDRGPGNLAQADPGDHRPDVRVVLVRATDVPTYVQYGGADLGVAGKDVLLEHGGEGLYQPLDLQIARCRMWVAVAADFDYAKAVHQGSRIRVATKYVADGARALRRQGRARRPDQAVRLDGAGAADRPGRRDRRPGRARATR